MKRFLVNILLFFLAVAAADICFGKCCDLLRDRSKSGIAGTERFIQDEMSCDVLVGGSSRGLNHYVPSVIEDSLGLSCYNLSEGAAGIFLFYARYRSIVQRYTPKLVIYEYTPLFDLYDCDDVIFLDRLKLLAGKPAADSVIHSIDKAERFKLLSSFYRYNTRFIQLAMDSLKEQPSDTLSGFVPVYGCMEKEPETGPWQQSDKVDPLKLKYLESFLSDASSRGIDVIVSFSPLYHTCVPSDLSAIRGICERYGAVFVDFHSDEAFVHDRSKFLNVGHMNYDAAKEYTSEFCRYIKQNVLNNN